MEKSVDSRMRRRMRGDWPDTVSGYATFVSYECLSDSLGGTAGW
jgi:hypothetical protein